MGDEEVEPDAEVDETSVAEATGTAWLLPVDVGETCCIVYVRVAGSRAALSLVGSALREKEAKDDRIEGASAIPSLIDSTLTSPSVMAATDMSSVELLPSCPASAAERSEAGTVRMRVTKSAAVAAAGVTGTGAELTPIACCMTVRDHFCRTCDVS